MPSDPSPKAPSPSLIAILLVTRTRAGPRINLHYPPAPLTALDIRSSSNPKRPSKAGARTQHSRHISGSSGISSSSVGWVSSASGSAYSEEHGLDEEDNHASHASSTPSSTSASSNEDEDERDQDDGESRSRTRHFAKSAARRRRKACVLEEAGGGWDRVLGWSKEGLAKLLAPGSREWHRKRFEVCLGELCFLGCPIFEREGGGWGGRKGRRKDSKTEAEGKKADGEEEGTKEGVPKNEDTVTDTQDENEDGKSPDENGTHTSTTAIPMPAKETSDAATAEPSSLASQNSDMGSGNASSETLAMFNVVFVLLPPSTHEHQRCVAEMWTHVAKPFARALRWQQKQHGWLWKEVTTVMGVRERAKERGASYPVTWPAFQSTSTLATALAIIFNKIINNEIAHVSLGRSLHISLQIPQPISTSFAPTPMSPQLTGLPVTTFDPFSAAASDIDGSSHRGGGISPYCALLLLEDPEIIAREVESDSTKDLARPLAYFIRQITPTKTLLQLSKRSKLSMADIKYLAQHLVRFRRARPIPPLHGNHTYIVSPNADMRKLREASNEYSARFSALPGLVQMLSMLGKVGRPLQPYGACIPSSDHKLPYMEILAWMMRGGWVTQLRTFAWVWVSSEVKAEVARMDKREAMAASRTSIAIEEGDDSDGSLAAESETREQQRLSEENTDHMLLSPRSKPRLFPPRPASEAGSTSSGLTAVRISSIPPASVTRPGKPEEKRSSDESASKETRRPRLSSASLASKNASRSDVDATEPTAADFEPSMVLSPHKANAQESKWLEHIGASLLDEDIKAAWPKLVKYFDGKHAIEEIPIREGWKRKVATPMLAKLMRDGGVLRTVRHW